MISARYLALIAMTLVFVGCGTGKVTTTKSDAKSNAKSTSKAPANATSEDVLLSAIYQLRPENFSLNSAPDKPVSLLNSWRFKQAEQAGSVEKPAPPDAPADWVDNSLEERLSQPKFDIDDAIHIRDSFFYRVMAGYLSDRGRTEIQRVGAVVEFVCRNLALWRDDETVLPLHPFVGMQIGKGSPSDRAFVCAEILRQLRIDSLIVQSKVNFAENRDKWLLGAIIDGKIYLYDMYLGLPLAGGPNETAASLDQIAANPDLLQQMATKSNYRFTAEDLRDPQAMVITEPSYWCQRMKRLEQVLPPEDACIIYESMTDSESRKGLISRIAAAGGWAADRVRMWDNSAAQFSKARQPLSEQGAQEFRLLTLPWIVPVPFKVEADGKVVQGTPERKFQRYRLDHLLGKFTEATQRYLSIRHLEVERHPAELERLNKLAAEDAFYWTALCKIELADYPAAVELLKDYLKRYDRHGKWYFPARTLLAQYQAQLGKVSEAISLLERSSSEDPYQTVNALRVKRWNASKAK